MVDEEVDELDLGGLDDGGFDDDELDDVSPDCPDGPADATGEPVSTATPIPNATANPPTRPTYAAASMGMYLTRCLVSCTYL